MATAIRADFEINGNIAWKPGPERNFGNVSTGMVAAFSIGNTGCFGGSIPGFKNIIPYS